jgi:class 3 adenylate cyclase
MDLSTVERMSRQEKQDLLSTVFNRLAGVLDAQNGKGDRVIGDNVTFADVTAAACVQWFLVFTEESEHILTLNGGRWKRLLEIVKA